MVNEIITTATNQTGAIAIVAKVAAEGFVDLIKEHNMAFVIMAFIGMVAVIGAVGDKVFRALKYVFLILIGFPAVIILGLINKKERKNRLKELGDIKAHLKKHPEKWKTIAFFCLCIGFILFMIINVVVIYLKFMLK